MESGFFMNLSKNCKPIIFFRMSLLTWSFEMWLFSMESTITLLLSIPPHIFMYFRTRKSWMLMYHCVIIQWVTASKMLLLLQRLQVLQKTQRTHLEVCPVMLMLPLLVLKIILSHRVGNLYFCHLLKADGT